jgi:hypothetical protein
MSFQQNSWQQNAFQIGAAGGGAPAVSIGWFEPFANIKRTRATSRAAPQQAFFFDPLPRPPSLDWHQPFANPKRPLVTARHTPKPAIFFDPFPRTPPLDWHLPLSEPQRRNAKLKTYVDRNNSGNTYVAPVFGSTTLSITTSYQGPTFTRVTRYQTTAFVPDLGQAAETVTVDKWFTPFTDPKQAAPRRQPAPAELALDPFPIPNPFFMAWFSALSDPMRVKQALSAAQRQYLIQGPVNELYRFNSTGPLFMRKIGGKPQVYWRGRTRT